MKRQQHFERQESSVYKFARWSLESGKRRDKKIYLCFLSFWIFFPFFFSIYFWESGRDGVEGDENKRITPVQYKNIGGLVKYCRKTRQMQKKSLGKKWSNLTTIHTPCLLRSCEEAISKISICRDKGIFSKFPVRKIDDLLKPLMLNSIRQTSHSVLKCV